MRSPRSSSGIGWRASASCPARTCPRRRHRTSQLRLRGQEHAAQHQMAAGQDGPAHRSAPASRPSFRRRRSSGRSRASRRIRSISATSARWCCRRRWHAGATARSRADRTGSRGSGRDRSSAASPGCSRRPGRHAGPRPECPPDCRIARHRPVTVAHVHHALIEGVDRRVEEVGCALLIRVLVHFRPI
jgi:hypothetical protein